MPVSVIMPKVDMDMDSGKLSSWHADEGAWVEKGETLFEIETDKAAMEVEAEASGFLHHRASVESEIAIGEPVAWLYAEGEPVVAPEVSVSSNEASAHAQDAPQALTSQPSGQAMPEPKSADTSGVRATPRARSMAAMAGLDLGSIHGSGPLGRVQARDIAVQSAISQAPTMSGSQPGALHVATRGGSTGVPIFLIHGFAGDSGGWSRLERLIDDRPLFLLDLPGHGKSPLRSHASFADLLSEVREAFDALDVERAHIIGHSLGGALALALADTRARRTASLTLLAPAGLGPEINGAVIDGLCRASRAESLAPWLRTLVADEGIVTDKYARIAMSRRQDPVLRATQTDLADALFPDGVQAFDLRAALKRISLPTRLIWGMQDRILPWKHAFQAPGHVGLHLFEGMGHVPQEEAPEAVGQLIRAHLAAAEGAK